MKQKKNINKTKLYVYLLMRLITQCLETIENELVCLANKYRK